MERRVDGDLDGRGRRVGIVAARWHEDIIRILIDGAKETLTSNGVSDDDIILVRVPGSFEIPLACQQLAASGTVDGVIALGCLVRGETDHYRLVADEVAHGVMRASLDTGVPVGFGVIAAFEQTDALERAGGKFGNKGAESAAAVLEMLNVVAKLRSVLPEFGKSRRK